MSISEVGQPHMLRFCRVGLASCALRCMANFVGERSLL